MAQLAEQSIGNPKFKSLSAATNVIWRKCGKKVSSDHGQGIELDQAGSYNIKEQSYVSNIIVSCFKFLFSSNWAR